MRGTYIVLFGVLGLLLFGCIDYTSEESGAGEDVIVTTDEECPGCATEEPESPPVEEEPEEEPPPVEENESEEPEKLTEEEARAIALNSSCMEEGNITNATPMYNNITYTWWFETDIVKEGCMPACVVDEATKTAEINWRCTGLIIPENETEEVDPYENATGCVGPSDTDYNIFEQEEVWYEGNVHTDMCTLATIVKDFYCKNGAIKDISTECPQNYDCRDGACKPVQYECTKTFGNDTTIKGHIIVVKGLNTVIDEYDECIDEGMVKEWVCAENGSGEYLELYCGSGMKCADGEGRCVRSSCLETDDGDDPWTFGTITFKDKDDEFNDMCTENFKLKEYYCYGDTARFKNYRCLDECFYDECVPAYE